MLTSFILAMVLYPGAFAKAQEEMDFVVGRERLPDLSDREFLPYLESVIKEVYRSVSFLPRTRSTKLSAYR